MGSFQDAIPRNHCFGCGPLNPDGLHIKSFWVDDAADLADFDGADRVSNPGADRRVAVCRWTPHPEHMAGPTHVLNGGIIATVLDCHTVCTAIADAYARAGRDIGTGEDIWYATGDLRVRYLAPTPLGPELELRAWVTSAEGRKTRLHALLLCEGAARAEAEVLAIRVPEAWRHGADEAASGSPEPTGDEAPRG